MVPKGWARQTIADVCDFHSGNGFKPSQWSNAGLPIIRIQNLNGSRSFNYFAGEPAPHWIVEPGQLLFAWAGTKGVSFGPTKWFGERGVLNQHIFKVAEHAGIEKDWLFLALKNVTDRIESRAHGFKATLLHVKKSDIDSQVVFTPPRGEQKRIAEVIAAWNKAIDVCQKLRLNSLVQHEALSRQLFSGANRAQRFRDNWVSTRLGTLLSESRIPGSTGKEARKLTVKLYGKGVVAQSDNRIGSGSTKYFRRSAGQFIYSKLDFLNGAFGLVPVALDGFESTLDLPAFDISDTVNPDWLIAFISRRDFYMANLRLANGGRKARRVNPGDLLRLRIMVPSREEQEFVANAMKYSTETICNIDAQLKSMTAIRKALMFDLLTGKRRVTLGSAG